jgi:hypothetical protein
MKIMKKLAIVLPVVGAIFAFLWLHFVEPNRELCDKVCDITARISHENTPGDSTEDKKKQRGEFWTLSDRVKHAFPCSPGIPKAVSEFAGVLE